MSKEMYDLCRRYKHFYNKYRDVKSWDEKYHDIDLTDALVKTGLQLSQVEDEMMKQLLKIMDVHPISVEQSLDAPIGCFENSSMFKYYSLDSTATVNFRNSNRFVNLLGHCMTIGRKGW